MGEFRIGKKFAQHSYPDNPRAAALALFARNFATGPKSTQNIAPNLQIPWNAIDVGTSPSVNVPITPRSTGIVRISGVVTVSNPSDSPITITVQIQIEGATLPVPDFAGFEPLTATDGTVTIPFLAETTPIDTPVGMTKHIQIFVDGDGGVLDFEASAIDVQEVSVATG